MFYLLGITFLSIVAMYLFLHYVVLWFRNGGGRSDDSAERAEREACLRLRQQEADHKARGGH